MTAPATTLTLRGFAGPEDYPIIRDLINATYAAADIKASETVKEVEHQYTHLENCDIQRDFQLATAANGRPLGYVRVQWLDDQEGLRRYHLNLNVGREGEAAGVDDALLAWAEARVQALAAEQPTGRPQVKQTFVYNEKTQAGQLERLLARGFAPVRYGNLMVRDLTTPITLTPLPEGVYVRACTPADDRPIFDALHEAFRDHWGYAAPPDMDADYAEWVSWPIRNPALYQVAFALNAHDGGEVAGMVLNFISAEDNRVFNLKRGWTDPIAVRRPWRKQGLARALIMRSLRLFADMGLTEAALGVDTQNPNGALQLYTSCGFVPVSRSVTVRKTLKVSNRARDL
jgi:GNAT superfamily N-acetyltransferase